MTFTEVQIKNWRKYEKVCAGGRWNMFMPQAQAATKLSKEEYLFCIKNYTELKKVANEELI